MILASLLGATVGEGSFYHQNVLAARNPQTTTSSPNTTPLSSNFAKFTSGDSDDELKAAYRTFSDKERGEGSPNISTSSSHLNITSNSIGNSPSTSFTNKRRSNDLSRVLSPKTSSVGSGSGSGNASNSAALTGGYSFYDEPRSSEELTSAVRFINREGSEGKITTSTITGSGTQKKKKWWKP